MTFRKNLTQKRRPLANGFTLLELLVVMVIIGLLAGLVGPRVFGKLDSSKVQTTKTQIRMLESAVNMYMLDIGGLPAKTTGMSWLSEPISDPGGPGKWNGPYIDGKVPKDAWDQAYLYAFQPKAGVMFSITSLGADAKPGGEGNNADISSTDR